jgi:hypothetical protein
MPCVCSVPCTSVADPDHARYPIHSPPTAKNTARTDRTEVDMLSNEEWNAAPTRRSLPRYIPNGGE